MKTWKMLRDKPALWERYFIREKVIKLIRRFFEKEKFHEVETPILNAHPPAESYLDVFQTTLFDRHRNPTHAYLYTSPEMSLKKLIVAGIGDCYSLTKVFRNMETQSKLHNPEFTLLEWYRVGIGYTKIMADCQKLIRAIKKVMYGEKQLVYQGKTIDLTSPWDRVTVKEAFARYANIHFDTFFDDANARVITSEKGYSVKENTTWEEMYNQIFLNEVEPHLGRGKPTFLYEFPAIVAALSRKKPSDPRYCERFELYIEGLELGDAYGELTDPKETQERFDDQLKEIKRLGKTMYDYDHDFIEALGVGMPACSGIAVGVDRLIMLFADATDIADTMFFPAKDLFDR